MRVSTNGFPQLKILQISNLRQLNWIKIDKDGMPRLTQLHFIRIYGSSMDLMCS